MDELKVGDEVLISGGSCDQTGKLAKIVRIDGDYAESNLCSSSHPISIFKKLKEENKMELKDLKKENLDEAKKQYKEEKKNAEIEFAKIELRNATDNINSLDRQIKSLEEQKKPYLEKIKTFS